MKPSRTSHLQPNIRTTPSGAKIFNDTVFSRIITDTSRRPYSTTPSITERYIRNNTADSGVFTSDENPDVEEQIPAEVTHLYDTGSPDDDSDLFDDDPFTELKTARPHSTTPLSNIPKQTSQQKVFRIKDGVVTSEVLDLNEGEDMATEFQTTTTTSYNRGRDVDKLESLLPREQWTTSLSYGSTGGGLQERQDLQRLNQRLASYIQHMQALRDNGQADSTALLESIKILEGEISNIKAMYERELDALRGQLDDANKAKSELSIHAQKYKDALLDMENRLVMEADRNRKLADEIKDLQAAIAQKESELANSEFMMRSRIDDSDAMLRKYEGSVRDCDAWKRRYDQELKDRQRSDDIKTQLEQKIAFDGQIFAKENSDLKDRLSSASNTILTLEAKIRELSHSDTSLHDMLQRVRDAAEAELQRYQEDSAKTHEANLAILKNQLDEERFKLGTLSNENAKLQGQIGEMSAKLIAVETMVGTVQDQNRSLEALLNQERDQAAQNVRLLEGKLRELQETLFVKMQEINAARDAQIPLKAEIEAYRVLLENEESRLKLPLELGQSHTHGGGRSMHYQKTSSSMVPIGPIRSRPTSGGDKMKLIRAEELGHGKDYFDSMFHDLKHEPLQSKLNGYESKQIGWSTQEHATSTSSATGAIKILDVNHEGKYIRIVNRSDKDEEIGDYILKQQIGGEPVAIFRFPPHTKLKSQDIVTVWAGGCNTGSHKPPSNFVWKEQEKWGTGPQCTTIVCRPNGQAIAWTTAAHRVSRDPYKAVSVGNSSPDADSLLLTDNEKIEGYFDDTEMDVNAPKPEPVYLRREKAAAPLLVQQKHPHGHPPPNGVHPATGQTRPLNYGNDHSSRNKQARSQSSRPDPIPGAPYTGASAQRMGSATLRSYTPPTIKGSGALANKAAGTIRYGPNTPFLSPLQQDFSKAVDSRTTSLAQKTF